MIEYIILRSFTNKIVGRKLYVTIVKEEKKMISAEEVRKVSEEAQNERARIAQQKAAKNEGLSFGDRIILYFIEKGIKRVSKRGSFSYAAITMSPAVKSYLNQKGYSVRFEHDFFTISW